MHKTQKQQKNKQNVDMVLIVVVKFLMAIEQIYKDQKKDEQLFLVFGFFANQIKLKLICVCPSDRVVRCALLQ